MTVSRSFALGLLATLAIVAGCQSGITPNCSATDADLGEGGGSNPCGPAPLDGGQDSTVTDGQVSEGGDDSSVSETGADSGSIHEAGADSSGGDAAEAGAGDSGHSDAAGD